MPLKENLASVNNKSWIFVQNNIMIQVFLILLKEVYNNQKNSDIGFKIEAQIGFQIDI